jgi:hypothetical protein
MDETGRQSKPGLLSEDISRALVAQLRGGAVEREAAYAELLLREAEHSNAANPCTDGTSGANSLLAEIAVACALPLCEVLCKPVSEVGAQELRRATLVLVALVAIDPRRVGGECYKPNQFNICKAQLAPESALGVLLEKTPAALTLDDALTAGCIMGVFTVQWSEATGIGPGLQAAGVTWEAFVGVFAPAQYMLNTGTPSDDRNMVLCPLLLELLRAPEKLPEFALTGVLFALGQGLAGRPAVAAILRQDDPISVLMGILRQATPCEWVSTAGCARRGHGVALFTIKEYIESTQAGGGDITAQLLSCGFIDLVRASALVGRKASHSLL